MKTSRLAAVAMLLCVLGFVSAQSSPPPPTVQFEMSNYYASEKGGAATITVSLFGDTGGNTVTVAYATSDGTATAASNDYTAASGTLSFSPGTYSQSFTVTVLTDLLVEGDETVNLTLSN